MAAELRWESLHCWAVNTPMCDHTVLLGVFFPIRWNFGVRDNILLTFILSTQRSAWHTRTKQMCAVNALQTRWQNMAGETYLPTEAWNLVQLDLFTNDLSLCSLMWLRWNKLYGKPESIPSLFLTQQSIRATLRTEFNQLQTQPHNRPQLYVL